MNKRETLRKKRHTRIKLRMKGTAEQPRLLVHRSLNNMRVVVIDDTRNAVICSFSTQDKDMKQKLTTGGNVPAAQAFGEACALKVRAKGITKIVFDRAGYLYHGRVKALADAMRKGGLEF